MDNTGKTIAESIRDVGISPNEADTNGEPANLVDGLFFMGRQLRRIADALEYIAVPTGSTPKKPR